MTIAVAALGAGLAVLGIMLAVVLLRQGGLREENALLRQAAKSYEQQQSQAKENHDAEVAELLDRLADANDALRELASKSPDAAGSYLERVLSRQKGRDDSRRGKAKPVPGRDDDGSGSA